jgi:amino acid transporter
VSGAAREGLGPVALGALVVASMVGTGVFTTSGFALADLGAPEAVLAAWALGGAHAALGAATYGWLAAKVPVSGGEFALLSRALHPAAGHAAGWVSLLAGFTAPLAAAAHGLEAYLGVPGVGWVGAAALVGGALLHGVDARVGAWTQVAAVGLKLTLLAGFLAVGLPAVAARPAAPAEAARWGALGPTLVWVSFSYSGWNAAIYLAGEARGGGRGLAAWSVGAVGVVTALYLGLNAVFVYAAPVADLAGRADVGVAAAAALGGPAWARALSGLAALALATSVSSMMMAGPRVLWAMGRAGALPAWLGEGDTPRRTVLAQAALALAAFASAGLQALLGYIGLTLSLSAALVAVALLRVGGPGAWRIVPWLFLLGTLAMAAWLAAFRPWEAAASAATLALGAATAWGPSLGGNRGVPGAA